jgi:DNA-binding protein HU-beta
MADIGKGALVDIVKMDAELDTTAAARRAVEAVFDAIERTLAEGSKVTIPGFGTFSTGHRNARTGRNPQTGAQIQIKACTTIKFKAGSRLKESVN